MDHYQNIVIIYNLIICVEEIGLFWFFEKKYIQHALVKFSENSLLIKPK